MASSIEVAEERTCKMDGDCRIPCSSSNELDTLDTDASFARHVLVIFRV